jgi:hypothetical protein
MPNGRTELDVLGCEFGRALGKDVSYMRDDIAELKDDVKELRKSTKRIEERLARDEWIHKLITAGVSAIVGAFAGSFWVRKG